MLQYEHKQQDDIHFDIGTEPLASFFDIDLIFTSQPTNIKVWVCRLHVALVSLAHSNEGRRTTLFDSFLEAETWIWEDSIHKLCNEEVLVTRPS